MKLRLWVFDYYKEGLEIPAEGQGGDDEATWARFRKWQKAIEERPSLKNTMSEREHYLPIYQVSSRSTWTIVFVVNLWTLMATLTALRRQHGHERVSEGD